MSLCKKCTRCEEELPLTEFTKNKTRKDGLNSACRSCHKKYTRKHYQDNKQYYKDKADRHKKRLRQIVITAKSVPCQDCGISYPWYVMDFDHRDPEAKSFNISEGWGAGKISFKTLKEEITKCDVVCSNCHRERTYGPVAQKTEQSATNRKVGGANPPRATNLTRLLRKEA